MFLKKLWLLLISSLFSVFVVQGAALGDFADEEREARVATYTLQYWNSYLTQGTMLGPEIASPAFHIIAVPKASDSSVTVPQVQKDKDSASVAISEFDMKKYEAERQQKSERAKKIWRGYRAMGIDPIPETVADIEKRLSSSASIHDEHEPARLAEWESRVKPLEAGVMENIVNQNLPGVRDIIKAWERTPGDHAYNEFNAAHYIVDRIHNKKYNWWEFC